MDQMIDALNRTLTVIDIQPIVNKWQDLFNQHCHTLDGDDTANCSETLGCCVANDRKSALQTLGDNRHKVDDPFVETWIKLG